jgi:hypothetical protein
VPRVIAENRAVAPCCVSAAHDVNCDVPVYASTVLKDPCASSRRPRPANPAPRRIVVLADSLAVSPTSSQNLSHEWSALCRGGVVVRYLPVRGGVPPFSARVSAAALDIVTGLLIRPGSGLECRLSIPSALA